MSLLFEPSRANMLAMKGPQDVAAAIILRHGRVLVTRRAPGQKMAGYWEFPGGKLEPEESVQTCIERELAEELALECVAGRVLVTNRHTYPGGTINLIGVEVQLVSEAWQLRVHDEARWVEGAELMGLQLAPADVAIAEVVYTLLERGEAGSR